MSKIGILIWLAAIIGVIFISTAATVFAAIKSADPYMKCCWRIQITSYCYLILYYFYSKSKKVNYMNFWNKYRTKIIFSGIFLGTHFCTWVLSLDLTSVAHSLLFVCSTPLLMVVYYIIIRKPIKKSEIVGVLVGFSGMIIICVEKNSPEGATAFGDLVALFGSAAIGINYILSENLVNEGGVFYLFIIHFIASITCLIFSLVNSIAINGIAGFAVITKTFEWIYIYDGYYAAYLGVFVGFIGNGCFYFMLKYSSPFLVVLVIFFEPVFGSVFAWWFGFQSEPSIYTWIGGFIILVGNFIVGVFAKLKDLKQEKVEDNTENHLSQNLIEKKECI